MNHSLVVGAAAMTYHYRPGLAGGSGDAERQAEGLQVTR